MSVSETISPVRVLDLVDDALCVVDEHGALQYANRVLAELIPACRPGADAAQWKLR